MIPLSYNLRNLRARWKTTLMTACGFTVAVAALVVLMAFARGIEQACAAGGERDNVLVLAKGDTDEVLSRMDHSVVAQIEAVEGVARDETGRALASPEHFLVAHLRGLTPGDYRFLQVRGVLPVALEVHRQVRLAQGRLFRPGQSEVVLGQALVRETGLGIGDTLEMGRKRWTVTGTLEADGSAFEAEVWCDLPELLAQFRRVGWYSSVVLRTTGPDAASALAQRLRSGRSPAVEALVETDYYRKQVEQTGIIQGAAWVIAVCMSLGAVLGVMNTMFAAIAQRTNEIAMLRILGYGRRQVLASFLVEAMLIAAAGGVIGLALGSACNGLTQTAALSAAGPSPASRQVDFAFRVDGTVLAVAATFAVVMGLLGGALPAWTAMRVRPLEALRT